MIKQLFTASVVEEFKKVWHQRHSEDPIIVLKLHIPWQAWSLLLYDCRSYEPYDEYTGILIEGIYSNYYDFLIEHLEQIEQERWAEIERDTLFQPMKLSQL